MAQRNHADTTRAAIGQLLFVMTVGVVDAEGTLRLSNLLLFSNFSLQSLCSLFQWMSLSFLHLLPLMASSLSPSASPVSSSLSPSVSPVSSSLSPSVSLVKFVEGDWVLDEPQFVLAIFLDVTALECQLPLEDSWAPAGLESVTNRPLARWQIKVSHVSNHFCNAHL